MNGINGYEKALKNYYKWLYGDKPEEADFTDFGDCDVALLIAIGKLIEHVSDGEIFFDCGELYVDEPNSAGFRWIGTTLEDGTKVTLAGDSILTLKSPSHVKISEDGELVYSAPQRYTLNGDAVDNHRPAGNMMLTGALRLSELGRDDRKKYSINIQRNGQRAGDYPHDYFDIYLYHVARFAPFGKDNDHIGGEEFANSIVYSIPELYQPLVDAIQHAENKDYFSLFEDFTDFVEKNMLAFYVDESGKIFDFSHMPFYVYEKIEKQLSLERGRAMVEKLRELEDNDKSAGKNEETKQ